MPLILEQLVAAQVASQKPNENANASLQGKSRFTAFMAHSTSTWNNEKKLWGFQTFYFDY